MDIQSQNGEQVFNTDDFKMVSNKKSICGTIRSRLISLYTKNLNLVSKIKNAFSQILEKLEIKKKPLSSYEVRNKKIEVTEVVCTNALYLLDELNKYLKNILEKESRISDLEGVFRIPGDAALIDKEMTKLLKPGFKIDDKLRSNPHNFACLTKKIMSEILGGPSLCIDLNQELIFDTPLLTDEGKEKFVERTKKIVDTLFMIMNHKNYPQKTKLTADGLCIAAPFIFKLLGMETINELEQKNQITY